MAVNNTGIRVAAIVGAPDSGKTALTESFLYVTGAVDRKGTAGDATRVGDASAECRKFSMSAETVVSGTRFLGESWVFLDCPGDPELINETYLSLSVADAAVVVCDSDPKRAVMAAPLLRFLQERALPHFIFINKVENDAVPVNEIINALQPYSKLPLVLREIPIRENGSVTGFVDLISERAYAFQDNDGKSLSPDAVPRLISLPDNANTDEERRKMLENLADNDDAVLEKLIEDSIPAKSELFSSLTRAIARNALVPVFFGAAEKDAGVFRLLKALRHDVSAPHAPDETLKDASAAVRIFKTRYTHTGKQSFARILKGEIEDGMFLGTERVNGIYNVKGLTTFKLNEAEKGAVVALGRMDGASTGDLLTEKGRVRLANPPCITSCACVVALEPEKAGDEVKLGSAAAKLVQEDAAATVEYDGNTGQMLLFGSGMRQISLFISRLKTRFNVRARTVPVKTPFKSTVSQTVRRTVRRNGKQNSFVEATVELSPLPRGSGCKFVSELKENRLPQPLLNAAETAVFDFLTMQKGNTPFTDVLIKLCALSTGKNDNEKSLIPATVVAALSETVKNAGTVLLEPVWQIRISVPSAFTSNTGNMLSRRNIRVLEISPEPCGGWDAFTAELPFSALDGFAEEMRSATQGTALFFKTSSFLREIPLK